MFVERVGARGSIDMVTGRLGLIGLLVVLVTACGASPEPRLEASPSVGVAVPPPDTTWEPSWSGRPDATIVLTGLRCQQEGYAGVLHPGVVTIEFVNEAYLDGVFKVVRLARDQRLGDLNAGPGFGGGWGEFQSPSTTGIWSSPREITSGRWAVVCWKDRSPPHGFLMDRAGIVGPLEVG